MDHAHQWRSGACWYMVYFSRDDCRCDIYHSDERGTNELLGYPICEFSNHRATVPNISPHDGVYRECSRERNYCRHV